MTEPPSDPTPQPPPAVQYSPDGRYSWDGRQWIPVAPAASALDQALLRRMNFEFEVGDAERHRVHFSYDQFWGTVRIDVDGRRVIRDLRLFSFSTTKRYRFTVGEQERHQVLIEKTRPWMAAGFRKQSCRVFVDGRAVGEYSS
jgi:hypothetical protein